MVANTGAYDTIGGPVMNLSLESAPGPYKYPHAHLKGISVYTNNAMGGEFRAFGAPQVVFGVEQELDKLAALIGMDPLEFRLLNAVEEGDLSALDHALTTSVGIKATLRAARETDLWKNREEIKRRLNEEHPRKKHGVGLVSEMHALGLGVGIPDFSNIILELKADGTIVLRTGAIEIGQGNLTAYAQMLAEALDYEIDKIEVINGDTFLTPDSGTVTASRSIMINGNAILNAVSLLVPRLLRRASSYLEIPEGDLEYRRGEVAAAAAPEKKISLAEIAARAIGESQPIKITGTSVMPVADKDFGDGLPHNYYTYITQIALVSVDTGTGEVELLRMVSLPEMGQVINLDGVEGQCEGGVVMGQGYALMEEVKVREGEFLNTGFSTYILPTALDAPGMETVPVEVPEKTCPFGAKGVGEAPTAAVAPAVANAVHDAVGIRLTELPITPEQVLEKLREKDRGEPEAKDVRD